MDGKIVNATAKPQRGVQEALRNFGDLPDEANVRVGVVAGLLSVSEVTVWRMTKDGRLPQPMRLSARHTAWNVGKLRQAIAAI